MRLLRRWWNSRRDAAGGGALPQFLTLFDSNYAAAGFVMIDSLRRVAPGVGVTVLCADGAVAGMLAERFPDGVAALPLERLLGERPEFAALERERTRWEFLASVKPVFVEWGLMQARPGALVAFVDSDCCFFGDPREAVRELAGAEIGVSSNRFSGPTVRLEIYGKYNAGFLLMRRGREALACVRRWRGQCLARCSSAPPEKLGTFMNQGYLDDWPERHPGSVVLLHPGVNLAPWNVGSHRIEARDGGYVVDGRPLVFFHFSSVSRTPDGRFFTYLLMPEMAEAVCAERLYPEYLARVEAESAGIMARHGISGLSSPRPVAVELDKLVFEGGRGRVAPGKPWGSEPDF